MEMVEIMVEMMVVMVVVLAIVGQQHDWYLPDNTTKWKYCQYCLCQTNETEKQPKVAVFYVCITYSAGINRQLIICIIPTRQSQNNGTINIWCVESTPKVWGIQCVESVNWLPLSLILAWSRRKIKGITNESDRSATRLRMLHGIDLEIREPLSHRLSVHNRPIMRKTVLCKNVSII